MNRRLANRNALTLLEVVLALGLTVVVMLLMTGLASLYEGSLDVGRDNVRQARIARAVLGMIADDLRSAIRNRQQDDGATLKAFLSSSSATGGGEQIPVSAIGGPDATAGAASANIGDSSEPDASAATVLPPGVYGTESSIEVDVSRPPRIEEYAAELANPLSGTLTDIPSDIKTVSYYVQAPRIDGIQDPLASLSVPVEAGIAGSSLMQNGGLVRRSIDRAVLRWASENGQTTQLTRTGQLIAPEVIALSFSYFDGKTWTTTWDSSATGVPWAVNISIYMQHAKAAREKPVQAGISTTALTSGLLADSGVEVYSMIVNIPGAQSLSTPAEEQSTGSADTSPTSALGF